jgi:hypothetical protein
MRSITDLALAVALCGTTTPAESYVRMKTIFKKVIVPAENR